MNIIIPLAGTGERFRSAGHQLPKPLIRARGYPLSCHCISHLDIQPQDVAVVVYHRSLEGFYFSNLLRTEFPEILFRLVPIGYQTQGAAETVLIGLGALDTSELSRPTLVADGDSLFVDDVLGPMRNRCANLIYFFEDNGTDPIYSYISLDENNRIAAIEEKSRISRNACIGAYGFSSADTLARYCHKTMAADQRSKGEVYISNVYQIMLQDGCEVLGHRVHHWECLGTPVQLRMWSEKPQISDHPYRFCFDLDNTLVTAPDKPGDYQSCKPIRHTIRYLRFLHGLGHTILIHTTRQKHFHDDISNADIDDVEELTLAQLRTFDIPHDELIFAKPFAHFYIDGLAILPQFNLEHQTGFYLESGVESRPANIITWREDSVVKSGPPAQIGNEVFWYSHLPKSLSDIAPGLLYHDQHSLEIERVGGIPLSQLFVNKAMSVSELEILLNTLERLHSIPGDPKIDIHDNYGPKIHSRYSNHDWSHLTDAEETYHWLIEWSNEYRNASGGIRGLIHGDPVFTNALITSTQQIRLIDPRGEVGGIRTLTGDIFYDLAKVFQSLTGYDEILLDMPRLIHSDLLDWFRQHIEAHFGRLAFKNLKMITASLYFTLIPFHDTARHAEFLELSRSLISQNR